MAISQLSHTMRAMWTSAGLDSCGDQCSWSQRKSSCWCFVSLMSLLFCLDIDQWIFQGYHKDLSQRFVAGTVQ